MEITKRPMPTNPKFIDLTGRQIGLWFVNSYLGISIGNNNVWLCTCRCGNIKHVFGNNLKTRVLENPGCKKCKTPFFVHGKQGSPEHRIWTGMKARCTQKKRKDYKDYGERGIKVCERWNNSFLNFLQDMGERPSEKHSIDRFPNNDGDYSPDNCRWATTMEQGGNRRGVVFVTANGETKTISDWSRSTGLSRQTISLRLKNGWSQEQAVTIKADPANGWKRPRAIAKS